MYLGNASDKIKQMNLIQKCQDIAGLQGQYERAPRECASMENTCLLSKQQKHKYNHMGWNAKLWQNRKKKTLFEGQSFCTWKVFVRPEISSSISPCCGRREAANDEGRYKRAEKEDPECGDSGFQLRSGSNGRRSCVGVSDVRACWQFCQLIHWSIVGFFLRGGG